MLRNSFDRKKPETLKEHQQFSTIKTQNRFPSISRLTSDSFTKSKIFSDLSRNHISHSMGRKIINLPMSPFGKHQSYNEESKFIDTHFSSNIKSDAVLFEKKTKFIKKKIRGQIAKNRGKKIYLKANQNMEVFKTAAGELYCQINIESNDSLDGSKVLSLNNSTEKWSRADIKSLVPSTTGSYAKFLKRNATPLN
ncbi:hypothetical protein SteCoe_999 [Stentor coeruleus]|uniref:Uncharacterized protein n=1 Tax=Stentor coeruleus TaxID=5963 RepID=A0A1R2D2Y5_9CILI|nr:hypothetical protein SteCoe_999 [Stentor coeruleus]